MGATAQVEVGAAGGGADGLAGEGFDLGDVGGVDGALPEAGSRSRYSRVPEP
jgi:hypothetical protein